MKIDEKILILLKIKSIINHNKVLICNEIDKQKYGRVVWQQQYNITIAT